MTFPKPLILIWFMAFSAISQEAVQPEKKTPSPVEAAESQKRKAEGDAFLAKNAKTPGVTVLPDGLQYRVIHTGTGKIPSTNELVFIKYRGHFIDGTEFDHHNHFLTWTTGGIKGWQDAMQRMKVGSKWELVVPPDLAFGDEGEEYRRIGPQTTLIYELELLSIAPPNPELATGGLGHGLDEKAPLNNSAESGKPITK
jgi:FKBP-type peptidyl-prolyl cis-trans isomerase